MHQTREASHLARLGRLLLVAMIIAFGLALRDAGALRAADPMVPPVSTNGYPPACHVADTYTKFTKTADWSRTLLDWRLRLPANYRPPKLVPVADAGLSGGGSVRSVMLVDLREMASAARAASAPLAVESAYRSYANQISTFNYWVRQYGYSRALIGSARAGHSEHQLGLALDFKSLGGGKPWVPIGYDWGTSAAGHWMMVNAWKYGFVLSYPWGKQATVCYGYEPWHYRYFGRTIAKAIHASKQAPRVWLWRHGNSPTQLSPSPSPTPTPID